MKFSIAIPVYNAAEYLEECLNSVLEQTFKNFEAIIIDDGSTDGSSEICNCFAEKDSRFKVTHRENKGTLATRCECIENAQGEWLVWVDSDDTLETNALERLSYYGSLNIDSEIIMYRAKQTPKALIPFNNGEVFSLENRDSFFMQVIEKDVFSALWNKAFRTDLLKRDDTDFSKYFTYKMSEDLLLQLFPFSYAKEILYIDEALYNYRVNSNSITHSISIESIKQKTTKHVYAVMREYIQKWGMDNYENIQLLNAHWLSSLVDFMNYAFHAADGKTRKELDDFDWFEYEPADTFCDYLANPFLTKDEKNVVRRIVNHQHNFNRYFFMQDKKKKWNKRKKHFKSVLFSKRNGEH